MRRARLPLFACAAMLSVAACSKRDPVDDKAAQDAPALPATNAPAPSASGEPNGHATAPGTDLPAAGATIPAALQGRWGLTPADCEPGRADAKGLLIVTDKDLRFYESRAVPAADVSSGSDSIAGNFAFAGEGEKWSKYQSLQLEKQGLVRTEINPAASFTYAKCT